MLHSLGDTQYFEITKSHRQKHLFSSKAVLNLAVAFRGRAWELPLRFKDQSAIVT